MRKIKGILATCAAIAVTQCVVATVWATDYSTADSIDKDNLERALFLCKWKAGHAAPTDAPNPLACTGAVVSVDDALLQMKQWWTHWFRMDGDAAARGKIQFNDDVLAFQKQQHEHPELAAELLPQSAMLPENDWRVLLVEELGATVATASTHK